MFRSPVVRNCNSPYYTNIYKKKCNECCVHCCGLQMFHVSASFLLLSLFGRTVWSQSSSLSSSTHVRLGLPLPRLPSSIVFLLLLCRVFMLMLLFRMVAAIFQKAIFTWVIMCATSVLHCPVCAIVVPIFYCLTSVEAVVLLHSPHIVSRVFSLRSLFLSSYHSLPYHIVRRLHLAYQSVDAVANSLPVWFCHLHI